MNRDLLLADTFVELADTLVADFDVIDFLHLLAQRSVQLLDVTAAGIMMADQRGNLQVMAASGEQTRLIELIELQTDQGPCLDCYRTGSIVDVHSVEALEARWPLFTAELLRGGFRSAQAIPLRLRGQTIGALNLFGTDGRGLDPEGLRIGQALADVATIGLLQQQALAAKELLAEQLQTALNSRVLLEQAKGVLAERGDLEMDAAFDVLRRYARRHGEHLIAVAEKVITGRVDVLADRSGPGTASAPTR